MILINGEAFEQQEFMVPPGTRWLPSNTPVYVHIVDTLPRAPDGYQKQHEVCHPEPGRTEA